MRPGWFIDHVASGQAFFTGLVLLAASVGIASLESPKWNRAATVLFFLGALFVFVSATPLPWTAYAIGIASLATWLFVEARRGKYSRNVTRAMRTIAAGILALLGMLELPYHIIPQPTLPPSPALAVIGDSISAGIGENEAVTWPTLLAQEHHIVVHDHSAMGATVSSARKQAAKLLPDDRVVVLEIGGNDLLGETTAAGFERGLEALLNEVGEPGRTVVMLELPLPPTFNRFGLIQRRLASKYDVVLVPKRVLMGVLARGDATLDSIHLSQSGHKQLADALWSIIRPSFQETARRTDDGRQR